MRSLILALGLLVQCGAVMGRTAALPAAELGAATVRADVFPRPTVHFPHGVIATPDVEYENLVGFRPLLLDLYRPGGGTERARPLVIFVHGGGWRRGDSRTTGAFTNFPAVLASLAARGYVVASVNYRLSGEARFPAPVQDVNAAIRYLRLHARQWGIDPGRIVLWGASAGAYLAAMSASTCDDPRFESPPSTGRMSRRQAESASYPEVSDCVQAVITWYGVFDLARLERAVGSYRAVADDLRQFLGCRRGACLERARAASPLIHVSNRMPPMLLLHGTVDTEVPSEQTTEMARALRSAHVRFGLHLIQGANHGWISGSAPDTRRASLDALRRTFAFIDAAMTAHPR